MIGQATAHRRANAFAQVLESADSGESAAGEHGAHAADRRADPAQSRMLAMAGALAGVPKPELDPETKVVQRAQLIAAMEAALADGTLETTRRVPEQRAGRGSHRALGLRKLRPRSRWSRRLAAGGLTVGVAAGAFSGVAAASTDALPGDTLYGLKRGMEDLRLGMASDDAARGKVLLDMASTRLQEARRLMERGRSGPLDADSLREVRKALLGMHNEASQGHDLLSGAYRRDGSLVPMETLNAFSQAHRKTWGRLRESLPAQLHDVGAQVNSIFDAIQREVAPFQSVLPQPPGTAGPKGRPGTRASHGTGFDQGGSHAPTPFAGYPGHGGTDQQGHGSAGPATTQGAGQGLIGGPGLLSPPNAGPTPSSGGTGDGKPPPEATLPPLLPGLLPGLGLSGADADQK